MLPSAAPPPGGSAAPTPPDDAARMGPLDPFDPPGRRGARRRASRAVYLDLDGTLVEPDGRVVPETLTVLARVRELGWRPVVLTGRSRWAAVAVARALGIDDVVCELGAVVRAGDHVELAAPEAVPFPREALLEALSSDVAQEWDPGTPRMSGLVLRSSASAVELTDQLHAAGLTEWCCVDNGPSRVPTSDRRPARMIHVLPSGVDKATGVRLHLQLRDLRPERCAVVGDSPADLTCHDVVRRTLLVRSRDEEAMAAAVAAGVPITPSSGARGALEAIEMLATDAVADA